MFSWFIRILLLSACVCLATNSHAKVCGDSPKLYEAIDESGFTVHDVWVTAPKAYTDATSLFELLRDYDFAVLKPGSRCKKMLQKLQASVFEHVRKYGTFIKPPEGGHWFTGSEAYMLSGKSSVRLDGELRLNGSASSADGEQLPGIYVAPGDHVLQVDLPRLPPGQRLHVVARLDGKVLKRSAPGTFAVEFAQAAEGNPVTHELTFRVKLVRECQATLKLSGKLTQSTSGRRIIFDVPTAGKALTPGANPLPGGLHKLRVVVMGDSSAPLAGPPVLTFGGGVLPSEDSSTSGRQSWDYDVDLSCPEGVATVQETLRAEGPPTFQDDDDNDEASAPLTWHFWAATGLTGVAATVGIVSYLSAEDHTEQWETLARQEGCATMTCDPAVLSEIADLYDQADTRYTLGIGSFVVAGVGAVGMGLSWVYREELAGTKAEDTALVPIITGDTVGLGAVGRF